ncbi:MAG: carboxypeptidase-like regulatory domain-containing protein [Cytophagales bacterium]|nr:carboxypeptidase-like regulatory domain-containing protein [Cytophagales bacterium]
MKAQESKPVIQFTGVVMEQDSLTVIPGVHIYVPLGGRGTTTNPYGFFSMPVVEGDSIIFTAIGFKRTHFVLPRHDPSTSLKVLVTLAEDITFLDEVEIFPFPTEAMFKHAVVTMQLPYNRENANLQAWLNATYMKEGYDFYAASPATNQRYIQDRQILEFQNKFGPQQNNLLNPWAWASFINSLKGK